jgi:putative ABC transport system substrate-binding protein
VFSTGADPVAVGLVESLNRPGGNLTGVTTLNVDLAAKRLEILRELLPASTVVALLINPNSPASETITHDMREAAPRFGLDLHILHAAAESDFEPAIIAAAKSGAGGLVIGTDALFNNSAERLGRLALIHKVPTVFQFREFVAAGGLMSYGGSLTDDYRQVGAYTGRILKGARPAELAVERSTKVELFLNLTSAKALGVPIGPSLLARADEVIE